MFTFILSLLDTLSNKSSALLLNVFNCQAKLSSGGGKWLYDVFLVEVSEIVSSSLSSITCCLDWCKFCVMLESWDISVLNCKDKSVGEVHDLLIQILLIVYVDTSSFFTLLLSIIWSSKTSEENSLFVLA